MTSAAWILLLPLLVGAPEPQDQAGPKPAVERKRSRGARAKKTKRKRGRPRPAKMARVDRAHIVGSPVLDAQARRGLYVWRSGGAYRFAVVGPGVTRFLIQSPQAIKLGVGDGVTWRRRGATLVGRGRDGAQGVVSTPGHLIVGPAKRGEKRVQVYVGPLARKTGGKVEIGLFGAVLPKPEDRARRP